jgi:hypothetical protein
MDSQERCELVADLLDGLERRGAVDGSAAVDLMRLEQNLAGSLSIVRRLVEAHVRAATGGRDA